MLTLYKLELVKILPIMCHVEINGFHALNRAIFCVTKKPKVYHFLQNIVH